MGRSRQTAFTDGLRDEEPNKQIVLTPPLSTINPSHPLQRHISQPLDGQKGQRAAPYEGGGVHPMDNVLRSA